MAGTVTGERRGHQYPRHFEHGLLAAPTGFLNADWVAQLRCTAASRGCGGRSACFLMAREDDDGHRGCRSTDPHWKMTCEYSYQCEAVIGLERYGRGVVLRLPTACMRDRRQRRRSASLPVDCTRVHVLSLPASHDSNAQCPPADTLLDARGPKAPSSNLPSSARYVRHPACQSRCFAL